MSSLFTSVGTGILLTGPATARIHGEALYERLLVQVQEKLKVLPDKPDETPETTLRALWHAAANQPKSARMAGETPLPTLDKKSVLALQGLIEQRLRGEPLAHLTGRENFMGIELLAGPEALVPRKETELLGYAALGLLRQLDDPLGAGPDRAEPGGRTRQTDEVMVLDLCAGTGNLAVAFAYHQPGTKVFASDLSPQAVRLAERNVEYLGLQQRVHLRQSDLFEAFEDESFYGAIDLVTCNPPYISSGKVDRLPNEIACYEPRLAFDGGPLGVNLLQRLVRQAPRFLRPGGWLAFEVGLGQGRAIISRLRSNGVFSEVRAVNDHTGEIRAILACRSHATG